MFENTAPTKLTTTEIVYTWPDGSEEIRYRRPLGSEDAGRLIQEVNELKHQAARRGEQSPYDWRNV